MKALKLGVFAITMCIFATSCDPSKTEETKTDSTNTTTTAPATPTAAPADSAQHIDTLTAKPAKTPAEAQAAEEKKNK
jgi:hypothetical protein